MSEKEDPATCTALPIATELGLPEQGVRAVLRLFSEGCTVPFIARYRKEATGGVDEVQIRSIEERHAYRVELEQRRRTILSSIEKQGKLTEDLRRRIAGCSTKTELEDLYLPFKPKRRTRATIAREKGLAPLATRILEQPQDRDPATEALAFVDESKGVADSEAALAGARDIVAEVVAENAEVRAMVRAAFAVEGVLETRVAPERAEDRTKYEQYYDHRERVSAIPSHRFLAIRRAEREGVLRVSIAVDLASILPRISGKVGLHPGSLFASQLEMAIEDGYRRLIAPTVETDVRSDLKSRSDRAAVDVFASNLQNLLLAAPLGARPVIGVDPGIRTGCKCAAVDVTGKYLDSTTIFPMNPKREETARKELVAFVTKHGPEAVAVGNGTAGRETEAFLRRVLAEEKLGDTIVVLVNESGASVYSASTIAREEFSDLDVTIRGAISIARRLQDPLAELVKIDPRSIGVGQYQHDVHQPLLKRKLDDVVESCVNRVGVELNTASSPLLARVAGIGRSVARNIVRHRDTIGRYGSRDELMSVTGLGPKAFEQAAGFLRIRDGMNALDSTAVHPERYSLVERIAADAGVPLAELVGNPGLARAIDIRRYVDDAVGEPTLRDIVAELERPGRDPRSTFEPPRFRDDVTAIEDLEPGMTLEGIVTNVTDFGAFVDLGVHQDGLVHISQLADRFVRDPHEVVKVGDRIQVKVLEVDVERKRIALTARKGKRQRQRPARAVTRRKAKKPPTAPRRDRGDKKLSVDEAVRRLQSRFNRRP